MTGIQIIRDLYISTLAAKQPILVGDPLTAVVPNQLVTDWYAVGQPP